MYLQGFTIDLDAPAGIAAEIVQIFEAYAERAIETSDRVEEIEAQRDEEYTEYELQKTGLAETILELEKKVESMSLVSEESKAKHRKALAGIMENLSEMDIK